MWPFADSNGNSQVWESLFWHTSALLTILVFRKRRDWLGGHSGNAITVKVRSITYPVPPLTFHWILIVYVPAPTDG